MKCETLLMLLLAILARTENLVERGEELGNGVRQEKVEKAAKVEKARVGPPRRRKSSSTVVGARGEEVKLVCPITGSPQPIIEWMKVSGGGGMGRVVYFHFYISRCW